MRENLELRITKFEKRDKLEARSEASRYKAGLPGV